MPEIPSVLIETAYISNPTEEKLLRTPAFQEEIAGGHCGGHREIRPLGGRRPSWFTRGPPKKRRLQPR